MAFFEPENPGMDTSFPSNSVSPRLIPFLGVVVNSLPLLLSGAVLVFLTPTGTSFPRLFISVGVTLLTKVDVSPLRSLFLPPSADEGGFMCTLSLSGACGSVLKEVVRCSLLEVGLGGVGGAEEEG